MNQQNQEEISKGYVYCSHCDSMVSRSTFKRHERKRYLEESRQTDQVGPLPDNEGEHAVTTQITFMQLL